MDIDGCCTWGLWPRFNPSRPYIDSLTNLFGIDMLHRGNWWMLNLTQMNQLFFWMDYIYNDHANYFSTYTWLESYSLYDRTRLWDTHCKHGIVNDIAFPSCSTRWWQLPRPNWNGYIVETFILLLLIVSTKCHDGNFYIGFVYYIVILYTCGYCRLEMDYADVWCLVGIDT